MGVSFPYRDKLAVDFAWNEFTGAVGDSVTVLPIVVAVARLTDLSLALVLVWFGVFQVVWGLYYAAPLSVEPMKALAALVLAESVTAGEALLAGVLLGVVLLGIGRTNSLGRVSRYIGDPVVRGVQFGVALVLLTTGLRLGLGDLRLAGLAVVVALLAVVGRRRNLSALAVLAVGGVVALFHVGIPSPTLPSVGSFALFRTVEFTAPALEAAGAQLAMTVGNAALATSVLLADYFNRDISADELASSMGVMNLVAVPFGGFPMCHGSGGVAGKYAFGARTAGANVVLGVGYVLVALFAVDVVAAFPVAMLGVVLAIIGVQLGRTSLVRAEGYAFVVGVGVVGVVVNLGVAFVVGVGVWVVWEWVGSRGGRD
ncbi:sulfate transporter [Haloferax mediterranei ATCC 33500]|uniref:Sulfate transporter n=1 Tax=Haloferax mediterranei (strain ATCC 33500 / DSM 1411 / JCM 8866 / NBRC 14739 / NCIMB 2177 / R-4) TaxID=523841 RepID=I3R715_HALMT|nr:putative sulfate/molybdate transporter [Haloferax mediterranei]AFK20025.1 sulfate transporter family permease [Haloferax mediterranei ATCC 33500]AHZ23402.1 sulfate transporter [Haloferax mediterranei ATCC 33500]ELZ99572.1 sulfate transporter family permease [Haloferax mediterranei ATCC 33500]MDX5987223.1 putative sulfate/molybdate transporter [Haloferax mediterranei ATCC 33500]QCQ76528.1 sulfate transporter [Haloferax mediterranei ATCC 33500]